MFDNLLLLLHFAASLLMVGIIWFVQIVHYPLFASVGRIRFTRYTSNHQRLTSFVVAGPMLLEVFTAALLLAEQSPLALSPLFLASMLLLLLIWISTALLQIPLHHVLSQRCEPRLIRRLVVTNWVRTIAWTLRALLIGLLIFQRLSPPVSFH